MAHIKSVITILKESAIKTASQQIETVSVNLQHMFTF